MNDRKKCAACGLIAFAGDEVCKRCGSEKLFKYAMPEDLPSTVTASSVREMHFLNFAACFILACIAEFVALLPFLGNLGMRHTSKAPVTPAELTAQYLTFISHLPTSIAVWALLDTDLGLPLLLATPLIQTGFWLFIFIKLWRKMYGTNKLK